MIPQAFRRPFPVPSLAVFFSLQVLDMLTKIDTSILAAALVGYQSRLEHIKKRIDEIRSRLKGRMPAAFSGAKTERTHHISAAGRARIAAAQRKRWANARAGARS